MKRHRFITLMALAFALLFLTAGVPAAQAASSTEETAAAGEAAPPEETGNYFAGLQVKDLYGNDFDATVFNGKPALINIWADWCGYCLMEMPALDKLAREYADRITIVGLLPEGVEMTEQGAVVPVQDKIDKALAVYEAKGIAYPTLLPDASLLYHVMYSDLRIQAWPTTWFIDGDGMINHIEVSAHDEAGWIELIDAVLAFMEENSGGAGS